ncbi:hypothetical protein ACWD4G_38935 [Streptomyces sp. NPDC002643]
MTQSGQGEEPLARTAREGIVLPSDGGAPLMPGDLPPAPVQPAGRPWGAGQGASGGGGPDAAAGIGQHPSGAGQGQSAADPYHQPAVDPYTQSGADPYGHAQSAGDPYTHGQSAGDPFAHGQSAGDPYAHAQPTADAYAQPPAAPHVQPAVPEWGGAGAVGAHGGGAPLPPEGAQGGSYGVETYGGGGFGGPLPPVAGEVSVAGGGGPGASGPAAGAPLPPVAAMDEGATQYIPPVPSGGGVAEAATQYIPPVTGQAPVVDAATQYLPPVGPGALPPETPSAEATTFLGRVPDGGGSGPPPPPANAGHPPHGAPPVHPDAQATQYIPPVTAAPPPVQPQPQPYGAPEPQGPQGDVFDSLFRSEPGAAGATQQLPRIENEQPYGGGAGLPPQAYGHGHGGHGPVDAGHGGRGPARRDGGGGRTRSRVPLIAAVGVGIAVLGIGAGALMSSAGSESGGSQSDNKPVSATENAPEESASPSADPAKEQAVALDKLLADSGNSRNTVVKAVSNIRSCKNLGQAATDLRGAAKQRNDLVTKLGTLSVDKLPNHAALTTALTEAWKASASADNHYAAWADQVAGKKGCKKGQARTTGQTQAGNKASATASTQKTKAAELWNAIAADYGLTERQAGQL